MMSTLHHQPIWTATGHSTKYPSFQGDLKFDVVIVGGGITGVTTAYLLSKAGVRVALATTGRLGGGTTGSTTGHLTSTPDLGLADLCHNFGVDSARLTIESLQLAIRQIQTLSEHMGAEVQFQRVPAYHFTEWPSDGVDRLHQEKAAADRLGIDSQLVTHLDLPFPTEAALRFGDQAMFHPMLYLQNLALAAIEHGAVIFEDTHIEHIEDDTPSRVFTKFGALRAHSVVLCTHSPVGIYLSLHTRVAPYQSYVVAFESEAMPSPGLYYDTSNPYFYLRTLSSAEPNIWIVGGCDHKTGQREDTNSVFSLLENYVRSRFQAPRFLYRWSNELFESVDGLPYIGRIPFSKSLYTGTGFAGVGLTFGTLAAMINTDLILNRTNEYAHLYSPQRVKPLASISRFARQNANVLKWYVGDRLHAVDLQDVDDLERGEGQILNLAGHKYAVYRDDDNQLHIFSPVCTHMGGIVHWNSSERTWDCPLHGGRYQCTGAVFEGPPMHDLHPELLEQVQPTAPILVQNNPLRPFPLQP